MENGLEVPLVVPEVKDSITDKDLLIANPNCSTSNS